MAQTNKTKDQETETKKESPPVAPVAPAAPPVTPSPPVAPPAAPGQAPAKKPVWPWILGGCLILVIITLLWFGFLAWLGYRSAKKMMKQYEPTINQTQQNIDKLNQEATKWQEKAQELSENMQNVNINMSDLESVQNPAGTDGTAGGIEPKQY